MQFDGTGDAIAAPAPTIAHSPTHLITLAAADLDGDGTPDLVTGGMHISAARLLGRSD